MKTLPQLISTIVLTALLFVKTNAQEVRSTNYFNQIKTHDLSSVLAADSIISEDRENNKEKLKRAEILGFIGEDYQRFYIHFNFIVQNRKNPYEYLIDGKTKVNETIRSFHGTITIKQAFIYTSEVINSYQQGIISCDVILNEDKKQSASGLVKGVLKCKFLIDKNGRLRYDALNFPSDDYSNNQFIGTWISYENNISKKCHWGDYRIPACGDLDIGAGEFSVNDKYLKNGWMTHRLAWETKPDTNESKQARKKEDEEWWK